MQANAAAKPWEGFFWDLVENIRCLSGGFSEDTYGDTMASQGIGCYLSFNTLATTGRFRLSVKLYFFINQRSCFW